MVTLWATAANALPAPEAALGKPSLIAKQTPALSDSFEWTSTGPIIGPKNDNRNLAAIKDPSIVEINGTYHVFASTAQESGYNLVYFRFTDFAEANDATFHYLDQSGIGTGYRAAPQVFYFAPHNLWYLVYQNGNAAYSTNEDIANPAGWTAPREFYSGMPAIIEQNIGEGYWVDMWVVCDETDCYLFSSDDNGQLYRSQTTVEDFPNGMSQPVIALQDADRFRLFEAACVYRLTTGGYLLLVEAIGVNGDRYFRSWTSDSIAGEWEELAGSEEDPFAGASNVVFEDGAEAWTNSISHGELIRTETDQTLTISPCGLRFLYQGLDPAADDTYNALPWRLGLITQTNSC